MQNLTCEFGKIANSFTLICTMKYPYIHLKFVWRQLEFAFFGALASVGASFILGEGIMKKLKTVSLI